MSNNVHAWTPERVEQLRLLVDARKSASEIQLVLNRDFPGTILTRSAIIGKVHRLGLKLQSDSNKNAWGARQVRELTPQHKGAGFALPAVPKVNAKKLAAEVRERQKALERAQEKERAPAPPVVSTKVVVASLGAAGAAPIAANSSPAVLPGVRKGVPLLGLQEFMCKAVVSADGEAPRYCGGKRCQRGLNYRFAGRDTRSSYCEEHYRRFTQAPPAKPAGSVRPIARRA